MTGYFSPGQLLTRRRTQPTGRHRRSLPAAIVNRLTWPPPLAPVSDFVEPGQRATRRSASSNALSRPATDELGCGHGTQSTPARSKAACASPPNAMTIRLSTSWRVAASIESFINAAGTRFRRSVLGKKWHACVMYMSPGVSPTAFSIRSRARLNGISGKYPQRSRVARCWLADSASNQCFATSTGPVMLFDFF